MGLIQYWKEEIFGMGTWRRLTTVSAECMENEHRELESFLVSLSRLASSGESFFKVKEVLDRVLDYARFHFIDEEALMKQHNYPELQLHTDDHARILFRIECLLQDYEAGRAVFSSDVSDVLRDWVEEHIQDYDLKLASFLNVKGVN
jgi:hemerythrin